MIKLNGKIITPTLFPDQTSQIWKIDLPTPSYYIHQIEWDFSHEGEFLQVAQLKDLLDAHHLSCELYLTYLPYGRQDKEIDNNTTFGLHTFSRLLNSLNFTTVWCLDPHSSKAEALINKFIPYHPPIQHILDLVTPDTVCFPDKGALNKYKHFYAYANLNIISGEKTRNQLTGVIESYKVNGDCKGKNVLIVDDIIDGGATFIQLAELLKFNGAKEVNLYATHGIFSKGVNKVKETGIKRIFTHKGEAFEMEAGTVYKEIT